MQAPQMRKLVPDEELSMKSRLLFLPSLAALLLGGCTSTAPAGPNVEIEKVIRRIQSTLHAVQEDASKAGYTFDSANATFLTSSAVTAGGKVSIFVVSVGSSLQTGNSQQLVFTIKPAKPPQVKGFDSGIDISQELKQAIAYAVQGAEAARKPVPPYEALELSSFEATFEFTVTWSGSAGVDFKLVPVDPTLALDKKRVATQRLSIKFVKK